MKVGWRQGWRNFVCSLIGHDMDYEHYVAGSFALQCLRCHAREGI